MFKDKQVKKEYDGIINCHDGLKSVMTLLEITNNQLEITDVINDLYGVRIVIKKEQDELINVYLDFISKRIKVIDPNLDYNIIYPDIRKKYFTPLGYEYDYCNRTIFQKFMIKLDSQYANIYSFDIIDNNQKYRLDINANKGVLKKDVFIQKLLRVDEDLLNIKQLLMVLSKIINIKDYIICLSDEKGNLIKIDNGLVSDYVEYSANAEARRRVFLENNSFYVEGKRKILR